jgi:hypothetical protein
MTNLSPAAQSVINAAVEAGGGYGRATPVLHARIAAALRAATDQLVDFKWEGRIEPDTLHYPGINFACDALHAIADDLGHND